MSQRIGKGVVLAAVLCSCTSPPERSPPVTLGIHVNCPYGLAG
jgi:hypothetical protein